MRPSSPLCTRAALRPRSRAGVLGRSLLALLTGLSPCALPAQSLEFHAPAQVSDTGTPQLMGDLAKRIIPVYRDTDRRRYLENLSALQLVAGSYSAAYAARLSLAELVRRTPSTPTNEESVVYDLHARALDLEAEAGLPYEKGFARSFEAAMGPLDDLSAYRLTRRLEIPAEVFRDALQRAFDQHRGQERIDLSAALGLIESYLRFDAQRSLAPFAPALIAADDGRRYVIDAGIEIPTRAGARIAAFLVRPRSATKPVPTLLTLTINTAAQAQARECAAHGYGGVVAQIRREADGRVVPFEHDAEDAQAVLGFIASQGWSDGRVGMYGSGYSGFTAWAAAKRAPSALRAIAVSSPIAPGINLPMEGSIFRNQAYRWLLHVTRGPGQDEEIYRDEARWRALDQRWYASGRPYRDLDRLYGVPSPIFQRWLDHPSYDRYWQRMIPGPRELARLDIPVLTVTGYYDPGAAGALHYFAEHHRYNPRADHTLLAGPYDEAAAGGTPASVLGGYSEEHAALIDLDELRFKWFDHVLRGGPLPAVLDGRVNLELMGADSWRHADALDKAGGMLRLYLDPAGARLTRSKPARVSFAQQTVNLDARAQTPSLERPLILTGSLTRRDSIVFVSDPLPASVALAGRPSLALSLVTNKLDLDVTAALYEQLSTGQYLKLHDPPFEQRASYAWDRRVRQLLEPGWLERLALQGGRLVGRQVPPGSRLVLVLGVKKRPDEEINYGSGKDVSQESRAEGRRPLIVRWYSGSHLDIPVWK
jgi:putative CocE/NonD family hydrolase